MRVQDVHLDTSWLHESPLHRPNSSKKQLQLSSSVELRCEAAQHEWLIVRELGVQPCRAAGGGAAPVDEGMGVHHDEL